MQAEVKGSTTPILEVSLLNGEAVVTPHGELAWMTTSIRMSQPAGGRGRTAGGPPLTRYEGPGSITFAAKAPGHIVPVDITAGRPYLVHRHGWLCGTPGITSSVGLQQMFRGGAWGGDGFILHKLDGDGRAWVELGGEVTSYDLPAGQTVLAHPGHVGMLQGSVHLSVTRVPGVTNALFGADGFHLVALTGPGRVWLQSMPLPLLAGALAPYLTRAASPEPRSRPVHRPVQPGAGVPRS